MPTSYTWNTTSGNWNAAGNWSPISGPPGLNPLHDDVVSLLMQAQAYAVTILGGQVFDIASLYMAAPNSGLRATLDIFGSLTTGSLSFTQNSGPVGGDSLIKVEAGGVFEITSSLSAVSPEVIQIFGRDAGGRLILGGNTVNASNVTSRSSIIHCLRRRCRPITV